MNRKFLHRLLLLVCVATFLSIPCSAFAARTVPVEVTNIQQPAQQPFQYYERKHTDIGSDNTALVSGIYMEDPVPEGKRLVVQYLSFRLAGRDIPHAPFVTATVSDPSSPLAPPVKHPLPIILTQTRLSDVTIASTPITIYVEAGQKLGVDFSVFTHDDVTSYIGITGYYIDVP